MWSAARITSASCSTTTMVLPRSRSSSRMRISRAGVAAVQPDGGLVEHVAGAHQARAEAGGELDALRLAAGERGREAVERQVLQADVVQELQPLADLDQHLAGDGGLLGRQLERRRRTPAPRRCSCAPPRARVLAADADVERLLAQARAVALRALRVAAVAAQEDAHVHLVLLGLQVVEEARGWTSSSTLALGLASGRRRARSGAPCARARVLRKLPSQERYFGLVHGSTAPSSSESVRSGITRSRS